MNKAELVHAVAERAGSSPAEARRHVDAVLESIVDGVAGGERVSLVGFGTFDSTSRAARTARNPRTGATVDVPAAVVPRFRIGAGFKAKVADAEGPTAARTPGTARRPVPAATAEAQSAQSTKVAKAAKATADGTSGEKKKKTSKKDSTKGSKGSSKNGSTKDKKKSKKGKKARKK